MYMGQVEGLYQSNLSLLDSPSAGLLPETLVAHMHIMRGTRGVKESYQWALGWQQLRNGLSYFWLFFYSA